MRIRRSASRLLGAAVPISAPPRFELPPPSPRCELPPPPARKPHASVASKTSSSPLPGTCVESFSPWDLMNQLDLSDPQEHERFVEENSVPLVRQASWLFPAITPAVFIKEDKEKVPAITPAGTIQQDEEEEEMAVDMVEEEILAITPAGSIKQNEKEEEMAVDMAEEVILELHLTEKIKKTARKSAKKKNRSKPKTRKGKEKAEVSDDDGGGVVWTRKKKDGQSDQKLPGSSRPRRIGRKRSSAFADPVDDDPFYFYTGFGPSRSKRQHRASSSRSVPEPPPAEEEEEAQLPKEHIDVTLAQAQSDVADNQMVPSARVFDEARCDDGDMAKIAGYDEMISSDGEPAGNIKRKIPAKKRWRKPVKARSINSLM